MEHFVDMFDREMRRSRHEEDDGEQVGLIDYFPQKCNRKLIFGQIWSRR